VAQRHECFRRRRWPRQQRRVARRRRETLVVPPIKAVNTLPEALVYPATVSADAEVVVEGRLEPALRPGRVQGNVGSGVLFE